MSYIDTMVTPDVIDQMLGKGVYSKDPRAARNAILAQQAKRATQGYKTGLNHCYAATKTGELSKDAYAEIRKQYDAANAE